MSRKSTEEAGIGHNSGSTSFAKAQLAAVVERIEHLEAEKAALSEDIKEVYAEAKGNGFDTKTLRRLVRERKKNATQRAEEQAMLDLYMSAIGMLGDTPLGQAGLRAAQQSDLEEFTEVGDEAD